ncbi:hypothetical protein HPY86_05500 [candidate division WOR-3 bacterium]|nr:hypothetical protein [candidate division WOR-3 bacterium]
MPWFGFIHPIMALGTFVYGLFIGQVSMTKLDDWDFPLRRVKKRTLIYFIFTLISGVFGLVVNAILRSQGRGVVIFAHMPLGIATVVAALLAFVVTMGKRKPGELPQSMRWHPVLVVISLALIMTMAFTALLKVLRI